jgi:hypothetical protein
MQSPTTAHLTTPIEFPREIGDPIWRERRSVPVLVLYGLPVAALVAIAVVVDALAVRLLFAAAAVGVLSLLARARRTSLIETYTVSAQFVTVEQRAGGRVAVRTAALEHITLLGDRVRIEGSGGVLTLGFVRRQRALVRALEQVAPGITVDRDVMAFAPTCTIRY